MADKLQSLKNRVRTERGHFTRLEGALVKALDFAEQHDNDRATAELIDVWEKFKKKTETVLELLGDLQTLDPANYATYEGNIKETEKTSLKAKEVVLTTLPKLAPPPDALTTQPVAAAAPAAGAGVAVQQYRVFDALKPFTLSRDHTPTELREWTTRFRAYYTASHIDQLQIPEQQAFLSVFWSLSYARKSPK